MMELTVQGKQIDVGDSLRTHVSDKLHDLNEKYLNHAAYATVTFSTEGHGHKKTKVHILIQLGKNLKVISDVTKNDPYVAFDSAAEKVGKQLRRYKRKLRDHHDRSEQTPESEIFKARKYVLAATEDEDDTSNQDEAQQSGTSDDGVPQGEDPVVIAEMKTNIEKISTSEAVMHLDLSGENALLFRNASNNKLNLVYRRNDGNIGWVDPEDS